jgi:hypothetical protein
MRLDDNFKAADGIGSAARTIRALDRFKRLLRSSIAVQMRRWTLNGYMALIRSTSRTRADASGGMLNGEQERSGP